MMKHVPLHLNALEHLPILETWLINSLSWSETKWAILKPNDWFDKAQDTNLIWAPPPAIAGAVVEQLCEAKHINRDHSHIFICPVLMTASWRKQLLKLADVLVTVPVGPSVLHSNTVGRRLATLRFERQQMLFEDRAHWSFVDVGFAAGLRGKEIPRIELALIQKLGKRRKRVRRHMCLWIWRASSRNMLGEKPVFSNLW
jgi:hypothetical protein